MEAILADLLDVGQLGIHEFVDSEELAVEGIAALDFDLLILWTGVPLRRRWR